MKLTHTVQVQVRRRRNTAHGLAVENVGEPVDLRCRFRRVSSGQLSSTGAVVLYSAYLLTTEPWPGGVLDEVSQVLYGGLEYDMVGVPVQFDGSPRTAHIRVDLKFEGGVAWAGQQLP